MCCAVGDRRLTNAILVNDALGLGFGSRHCGGGGSGKGAEEAGEYGRDDGQLGRFEKRGGEEIRLKRGVRS